MKLKYLFWPQKVTFNFCLAQFTLEYDAEMTVISIFVEKVNESINATQPSVVLCCPNFHQ